MTTGPCWLVVPVPSADADGVVPPRSLHPPIPVCLELARTSTATFSNEQHRVFFEGWQLVKAVASTRMAGLPSHLFVVRFVKLGKTYLRTRVLLRVANSSPPRHGNRLDAADKKWHLSSPTPYDPPLTYGGWLQARQVGNQIGNYLEQAKVDAESSRGTSTPERKRRRFKVVIHSSPFLRCIQTSIGISSGLAQTSPESSLQPSDLVVPVPTPAGKTKNNFRSSVLRLDSYLGEWLSHEYFENITPPPSSSLMLGTAKADLLKREDYSAYTDFASAPQPSRKASLWNGSPDRPRSPTSGVDGTFGTSSLSSSLPGQTEEKKGYGAPRPTYAVSSAGKIPDGFVAHSRDECLSVDYQWDSMRPPLDFGDGGILGEEWTSMHKRFRRGLKKMVNWYATAESPERPVSVPAQGAGEEQETPADDEEVETVVIIVSHGAGCNALIGAITHQPVLMDVAIASITMAVRKPDIDYAQLRDAADARDPEARSHVPVDQLYDIRLSASTEHLQSTGSTPVSSRSSSMANVWTSSNNGARGRTSTLSSSVGPSLGAFTYSDPLSSPGSRSTSANAAIMGTSARRDSGPPKPAPRQSAMSSIGIFSGPGNNSGATGGPPTPTAGSSSLSLWTPTPSSLRLMDDGTGDADKDDYGFPDFDQKRLKAQVLPSGPVASSAPTGSSVSSIKASDNFRFAAPIKLQTNWGGDKTPEEVPIPQLGDGQGGLWGQPRPPGEAEVNRDRSHTKRRWTVNERPDDW